MAVSTDGGKTFTDHVVHTGSPSISCGHQFVNLSIDRAGNLYSVYSDDHNIYYSFSQDHGTTWSGPYKINTGAAGQQTAIMPWSVAGDSGRIDVVYYGADYYAPGTSPDSYPCNDSNHCASVTPNGTPTAHWNVYLAENISALAGGTSWSTTQVTSYPVHYGGVCEGGVSCTGDRSHNRDLYDDFGIAVSRSTTRPPSSTAMTGTLSTATTPTAPLTMTTPSSATTPTSPPA